MAAAIRVAGLKEGLDCVLRSTGTSPPISVSSIRVQEAAAFLNIAEQGGCRVINADRLQSLTRADSLLLLMEAVLPSAIVSEHGAATAVSAISTYAHHLAADAKAVGGDFSARALDLVDRLLAFLKDVRSAADREELRNRANGFVEEMRLIRGADFAMLETTQDTVVGDPTAVKE